jgi:hypothetical protein
VSDLRTRAREVVRLVRRGGRRAGRALLALLPTQSRARVEAVLERRRVRRSYAQPLVPEAELEERYVQALRALSEAGTGDVGDYLEFGVCHGSSMRSMHRAMTRTGLGHVRMFGFDSFEGLPPEAADDDGGVWRPGQFPSDEEYTRQLLTQAGVDWGRTRLVRGWFSETLTPELLATEGLAGRVSMVMVDCDMYLSAKQALDFCAGALGDRAIVFFDDWRSGQGSAERDLAERNLGEKRAFDEFLAEHPEFHAVEQPDLRYAANAAVFLVTRT